MTADDFRAIALGFTDAVESAHMQHPDFRVGGKVFASLGHPTKDWGMVKLTPSQQARFLAERPDAFAPSAGAWGRRGYTNVRLRAAKKDFVREAMALAWRNVAPKRLAGTLQWP